MSNGSIVYTLDSTLLDGGCSHERTHPHRHACTHTDTRTVRTLACTEWRETDSIQYTHTHAHKQTYTNEHIGQHTCSLGRTNTRTGCAQHISAHMHTDKNDEWSFDLLLSEIFHSFAKSNAKQQTHAFVVALCTYHLHRFENRCTEATIYQQYGIDTRLEDRSWTIKLKSTQN